MSTIDYSYVFFFKKKYLRFKYSLRNDIILNICFLLSETQNQLLCLFISRLVRELDNPFVELRSIYERIYREILPVIKDLYLDPKTNSDSIWKIQYSNGIWFNSD